MIPLKGNVPTRGFPTATLSLIAVNLLVWAWEVSGTPVVEDVIDYGYYPCALASECVGPYAPGHAPIPVMIVASMFLHAGWLHVIGNMLFLWIFGPNVEDAMSKLRFVVFYLAAGLAATTVQTFVTLQFGDAMDASIPNIGASGAVAGVLGAYFILLPMARILTLIFFIFVREISAVLLLGFWFLLQLWQGGTSVTHPQEGGGVAFFAHVGGFLFGMFAISIVATRKPEPQPFG